MMGMMTLVRVLSPEMFGHIDAMRAAARGGRDDFHAAVDALLAPRRAGAALHARRSEQRALAAHPAVAVAQAESQAIRQAAEQAGALPNPSSAIR
jgi:hypothetical protein